jgi:hypothetical protein
MKLKKLLFLPIFSLSAGILLAASSFLAPVSVTLQNKCTRAAKYEVKGGTASSGTVEAGSKVKLSLEVGQKVFVDGEICLEVSAADNGSTYIVCR